MNLKEAPEGSALLFVTACVNKGQINEKLNNIKWGMEETPVGSEPP